MSDWDNIKQGQTFKFAKNERKAQALAEGKDNADYYPDYTTTFQGEHTNNVKIPEDLIAHIKDKKGWCQMSIKINRETQEISLNLKGQYVSDKKPVEEDKPPF
jgi:hypothetical protein